MPRNRLSDLNDLLFEAAERLLDEDLDVTQEVARAKALTGVGKVIVQNAALVLEADKHFKEYGGSTPTQFLIEGGSVSND